MNRESLEKLHHPILLSILVASLPVSLFAPKALAPLLVMLWLPVLRLKPTQFSSPFILVMALVVWALFESIRAPLPLEALQQWARVTLLTFCGIAVLAAYKPEESQRLVLCHALVVSFAFTLFLCVVELGSGNFLMGAFRSLLGSDKAADLAMLNRGACFIALMIWPTMLATARLKPERLYLPLFLWAIVLFILSRLESLSALLAVVTGAVALAGVKFLRGKWRYAVPLGVVVVMLATPFIMLRLDPDAVHDSLPLSAVHRLHIWKFTSHKAAERPLLGHGFRSEDSIAGAKEPIVVNGRMISEMTNLPGHPHNSILQLWLELGVFGVLLYTTLTGAVMVSILRNERLSSGMQAILTAVLVSYFTIGMTAFGIWQEWWIAAGFLAVTAVYAVSSARASAQKRGTSSASGLSVGSMPA